MTVRLKRNRNDIDIEFRAGTVQEQVDLRAAIGAGRSATSGGFDGEKVIAELEKLGYCLADGGAPELRK